MQQPDPNPTGASAKPSTGSLRTLSWRALGASSVVHVGVIIGVGVLAAQFGPRLFRANAGSGVAKKPVVIVIAKREQPEVEQPEPEWTVEPLFEPELPEPVPRETTFPDEPALVEPVSVSTTLVEVAWWTEPLELPRFAPQPPDEPESATADTALEATDAARPEPVGLPEIAPSLLSGPPPTYPALAQRRGWEGVVLCNLEVDAQGNVAHATVADSSGHELLDAAAIDAVQRWRFNPGERDGVPATFNVQHRVRFQLRR